MYKITDILWWILIHTIHTDVIELVTWRSRWRKWKISRDITRCEDDISRESIFCRFFIVIGISVDSDRSWSFRDIGRRYTYISSVDYNSVFSRYGRYSHSTTFERVLESTDIEKWLFSLPESKRRRRDDRFEEESFLSICPSEWERKCLAWESVGVVAECTHSENREKRNDYTWDRIHKREEKNIRVIIVFH